MVQWLGLHPSTAGSMGSIPGWGSVAAMVRPRPKTKRTWQWMVTGRGYGHWESKLRERQKEGTDNLNAQRVQINRYSGCKEMTQMK